MKIGRLKCNGEHLPLQVDYRRQIFLSWNLLSSEYNKSQSAYQVQLYDDHQLVWNSGRVQEKHTNYIAYGGSGLKASTRYYWQVRVWDEANKETSWSERQWFETGITGEDWTAQWIGYDQVIGAPFNPNKPFYCADNYKDGTNEYYLPPLPYLRKTVTLSKPIKSGKVYVSALGLTKVYINGKELANQELSPGFSDYRKRVYSRVFLINNELQQGPNGLGLILADGWYAGYMGLNNREWYGSEPRAIVQIELTYADGTKETIGTDETWKANYGALLEGDLLQGTTIDARLEPVGWSMANFDDSTWAPVACGTKEALLPIGHIGHPIVVHDRIPVKWQKTISSKKIIACFEHYIGGVVEVVLRGKAGSKIEIRHAELLTPEGTLHLDGNRSARCLDTYILSGDGEERFLPPFTYHGFQYIEVTFSGPVEILEMTGIQLGTQIIEESEFHSSNETINEVFQMIKNTEKANLLETPIDCTARDERIGWGMEGNMFLSAMAYLNNAELEIRKWNEDIWDGQRESGALEAIAPAVLMEDIEPFVGDLQSHHGIYMVYLLYKLYGDEHEAQKRLPDIHRYFEYMVQNSDRYIRYATACDWLGILEETNHSDVNHGYGECSSIVLGTACFYIVTEMMVEICRGIKEKEELSYYEALSENIKAAFRRTFIQRDGTIRNGKQGEYLIALCSELIEAKDVEKALKIFIEKLTSSGYVRWFGGTATTPFLLSALKRYQRPDLANQFLSTRTYPSLGYMLEKGADTTWERWDAIYEDGSIHPQSMNAISHIGFAAVGDYLISGLAGIDTITPGFSTILIAPALSIEVTEVKASYMSIHGIISTESKWEGGVFYENCIIPPNTTAVVVLPSKGEIEILHGEIRSVRYEDEQAIIEVGSGSYGFRTWVEKLVKNKQEKK